MLCAQRSALHAVLGQKSRRIDQHKNWLPRSTQALPAGAHIAIIGAGIAGATLANKLVQRGFKITVFEAQEQAATQASGNIAGNVLPVIDNNPHSPYAQWYWQAWQTTYRWWQAQANRQVFGTLEGASKWSGSTQQQAKFHSWANTLQQPDWVCWQHSLSHYPNQAGLWFAKGGHLQPKAIIAACLNQPNIRLITHTSIEQLTHNGHCWQLSAGQRLFYADALVMTTGAQTGQLLPEWSPHITIQKGQVSHVSTHNWKKTLSHAISYGGYTTPAVDGTHCVGASFEGEAPLGLTEAAHRHNLELLHQADPNAFIAPPIIQGGHSAYRATTLDHLPLVGPLIRVNDYQQHIHPYRHQPDKVPACNDLLLPNAWINSGHGAHGLTSAFLAAEVLCAEIQQTASPISTALNAAIHPARVFFRQRLAAKQSS